MREGVCVCHVCMCERVRGYKCTYVCRFYGRWTKKPLANVSL